MIPYPVDATALVDTHLVFVPDKAVDQILDEDPAMARLMLASMAKRLQAKIQDIAMLSLQSATQRIVAYVPAPCATTRVRRDHLDHRGTARAQAGAGLPAGDDRRRSPAPCAP